ncbi:capsular polysaccharide synthesis protein [Meridianimarinicoccus sp. RP-17]|uniref:capsular polysaccharide synthesis protein n=1 Tax=Meridianimarinicoccus zhengii TaxID=2056810 RepID=UPI000DACA258|nr:capsular polysaccharide synthesis protein [Phycocomes zhengii]
MPFSNLWTAGFAAFVRIRQGLSHGQRAWRKLTGRRPDGFAGSAPRAIPRRIWAYWDQGEAAAPPVVRACLASWRQHNPGWDLTVLDRDSAPALAGLPMDPGDIPVQSYADLLRLRLLAREGGVWVDATTFCLRPLDHWLPMLAQGGFFAFTWTPADRWFIWPNVPRRITNWFLASEPGGAVISAWDARARAYWQGRRTPHVYYWPHLMWDFMALTERRFGRMAAAVPRIGCFGPHLVHDHVQTGRDAGAVRAMLDGGAVPFQKLRWNWSDAQIARAQEVLPALAPVSGPASGPVP